MKYLRSLSSAKIIIVIACLLLMLVSPTRWSHAASVDRDKLLEGAKKEGRLVLYAGMELEEANLYSQEFTKKYPFIKTDVFRSAGEKIQARFLVEHRANTHIADIFQASIVQVYQLKNSGLLARYVSRKLPLMPTASKTRRVSGRLFTRFPT